MAAAGTTAVLWRIRLGSALRAAFACSIVGAVTMFGPAPLRHLLAFSAYSYFTTISIVLTDANSVGDAVRSVWRVMWAVASVLVMSVPCLWLIGTDRFTGRAEAAVGVAVSAFVVALPERAHLLTKRIAFGQLVIVYVGTVVNGGQTSFYMHPIRVAASTAAGALAAIAAMMIPYPRLASFQIRKLSGAYCENGCERMGAMVEGLCANSKAEAIALMAQANSLSITSTKLLPAIKANLKGMIWERQQTEVAEKLEEFEVAMAGMESAIASPSITLGATDQELCNFLTDLKPKAATKLRKFKISILPNATTSPETKPPFSNPLPLNNISPVAPQILPVAFFLRCLETLLYGSRNPIAAVGIERKGAGEEAGELGGGGAVITRWGISSNMLPATMRDSTAGRNPISAVGIDRKGTVEEVGELGGGGGRITRWGISSNMLPAMLCGSTAGRNPISAVEVDRKGTGEEPAELGDGGTRNALWGILSNTLFVNQSLRFALKCSVSLGLAVFMGLSYTKQNGYWSGLTVAISLSTERQAIFTVANARAQGTAMGSIYGVLCCFVLRKHEYFWLLPLIPWVVFTSFLVHSKMYGPAGGIASALGALLVLGRKGYGLPSEFANDRITEACIGLLCFLAVEIIFNSTRAATLAKTEFSMSLKALQGCIKRVILVESYNFISVLEHHKTLKSHVGQLEKFIVEAGYEPNFWFTPFQTGCYHKLLKSLQKTVNVLQLLVHEMRFLSLELNGFELVDSLREDMDVFSQKVGCSLKFMEKLSLIKSLKELQNQNQNKNQCSEMEMGKVSSNEGCRALAYSEEDIEKVVGSFCQNANEILAKVYGNGDESEASMKGQMTLCLSSIGFCLEWLMRETMVMEKEFHQLLKLENPTIHLNLQELSTKVNAHCCK